MTTLSAFLLLFVIIDPFGNIPLFLAALREVPAERRQRVLVRELLVALAVLVGFLFCGRWILEAMQISQSALGMAGGIVLFLIAVKMIFPAAQGPFGESPAGEPFIVPLAVPLLAGPSAMASVMLLVSREPARWPQWLLALFGAWAAASVILVLASPLSRLLGDRCLAAVEKLMGMILTVVAVQMTMTGIREFLALPHH